MAASVRSRRAALAVLCAADLLVMLDESRDEAAPRRLDLPGSVLVAAGCGLLVLGIVQAEHHGVQSPSTLGPLAGSAALLTAFVAVERRVPAPVVRPGIFRVPQLTGANLALAANAGGFTGMTFLSTLYMQGPLGLSALETGPAFLPLAISAGAGGLAAPRLVERFGPRRVAATSQIVTAAGFAALSPTAGLLALALVFTVTGFSFATAFVPLTGAGLGGVAEGEKGLASGVLQTSTHLGGAIMLAGLATVAAGGFAPAYLAAAGLTVLGSAACATLR